ncbi:Hypothetical protein HDN1F_10640 [gamma proteobacterium HdN1]|nr:Hypothetical protein HDN1F_10640 [gamma proteobacterium HdN1]
MNVTTLFLFGRRLDMNKNSTGKPTHTDLTDWARVAAMSDEDIICDDENPALTEDRLKGAVMKMGRPVSDNPKITTTVRFDADVIAFFKASGKGWQTRMNAVLREYVASH